VKITSLIEGKYSFIADKIQQCPSTVAI